MKPDMVQLVLLFVVVLGGIPVSILAMANGEWIGAPALGVAVCATRKLNELCRV